MKKITSYALSMCFFGAFIGLFLPKVAFASEGGLDWTNFSYRIINLILVIGIVYYFYGKKICMFFSERRKKIIEDFDNIAEMKVATELKLKDMNNKMKHLEDERKAILTQAEIEAQKISDAIIAEANTQAEAIRFYAEQSTLAEIAKMKQRILTELAGKIFAEVEQKLADSVTPDMQKNILQKSIEKVVSSEKQFNS